MNSKDIQTYIIFFIVITGFGILYNRWEQKNLAVENNETNHHIAQFLLNRNLTTDYDINTKPFLCIHVEQS